MGVGAPIVPGEFAGPEESGEGDGERCSEVDMIVEVEVEGLEHGEEERTLDFPAFTGCLCTGWTKGAVKQSLNPRVVEDSGRESVFDMVVLDPDEVCFDGI
jgi:hypothetical protein